MTFEQIIIIFTFIFSLSLGLFILLKGLKNQLNWYFFLIIIAADIWIFTNYLIDYTSIYQSYELLLFWSKITFVGPLFLPFFFIRFAYLFPKVTFQVRKLYWYLIFLPVLVFIFFIPSDWNIQSVTPSMVRSEVLVQPGYLYYVYALYFVICLSLGMYWLYVKYKSSKGIEKSQISYFFIGFLGMILPGVVTNEILLLLGITKFAFIGPIFVVVFATIIAYSILAHHLFDIRVIIKKTVIYTTLLLFASGIYAIVVFSATAVFGSDAKLGYLSNIIAAVLIVFGFGPLQKWITNSTDKWLFKGEYDTEEVLKNLSTKLSGVLDFGEAIKALMSEITKSMRIKQGAFFLLHYTPNGIEPQKTSSICYNPEDECLKMDANDALINYFNKNINKSSKNSSILVADIFERENRDIVDSKQKEENQKVVDRLKNLSAAVVIPIIIKQKNSGNTEEKSIHAPNKKEESGKKLIGILVLGEKLSGDVYNEGDIKLLEIASGQVASASEKARLYEEDQLKSEFVSIASHELLTPTSAIEGYLSMILDEKLAKIDKKAEEYLRKVYASSKRLAALVKDLLNVSRIESGRIVIQWQAYDIVELIKEVIDELMPKAKEKKLDLSFVSLKSELVGNAIPKETKIKSSSHSKIMVFADQDRTHQILVNLIGNAIKYSLKGSVKVTCMPRHASGDHMIEVAITDTGIGIPKANQDHLFEKFYRADNASTFGAGGTGLGLYISKNLVELMGGNIWLSSVEGKGTTFYLLLKVATSDQIKNYSKRPEGEGFIPFNK